MILDQLKEYIQQRGPVSQKQLATHFHLTEDGVQAMLEVWIVRGQLIVSQSKSDTLYRWKKDGELGLKVLMN